MGVRFVLGIDEDDDALRRSEGALLGALRGEGIVGASVETFTQQVSAAAAPGVVLVVPHHWRSCTWG